MDDLTSEVNIKTKACEELINSVCLRKILGIILKVGNRLNRATEEVESISPDVNGFSVESLSKLNQVKACDKKTTILFYIISLIQRSNHLLLDVKDDLPHLFKAQSISSDHDKSLITLGKQLSSAKSISIAHTSTDITCNETGDNHTSYHVQNFVQEASQSLDRVREANKEASFMFHSVLEYFSIENNISPNALFNVVASFCKEIDSVNTTLSKSKGKKVS